MGLEEASRGKRFTARQLESGRHITNLRNKLHAKTFDKICRTIDEAIEDVVATKTKLVWLNTGSLVGDRASLPHSSHQHLWDAVFPSDTDPVALRGQRITVGALIKWRVALRDEDWLVHYRETGKTDILTGDPISASEYWIKPAGVVLKSPRTNERAKGSSSSGVTTIEDLKKKFSRGA